MRQYWFEIVNTNIIWGHFKNVSEGISVLSLKLTKLNKKNCHSYISYVTHLWTTSETTQISLCGKPRAIIFMLSKEPN